MTKKYYALFLFLATFCTFYCNKAIAECDGFYLAGRAGGAKYKLKDSRSNVSNHVSNYVVDKKRFMASGALGYRYKHFRGELEYVWRKKNTNTISGITDAKFQSQSYMFVVYYDFFPYQWFTPFINAGIGYTRNKLDFYNKIVRLNYQVKENAFTWSIGGGLSAKITNRWNLDIGYRYYDMGELSEHNGKTDISDQEIYAGLRYVL